MTSSTLSPAVSPAAPDVAQTGLMPVARRNWWNTALGLALLLALFLPPALFGEDQYRLPQYTRYLALALFALSVDLVWGYTGLLSLGQGLYFGLGAYAMGYCLILQQAAANYGREAVFSADMARPDFMMQCRLDAVPPWIGPLINVWIAIAVAVVLPTLLALAFSSVVFRRNIKGVYFSLITQALLMAVFLLISNQRPYTGGVDGLTGLANLTLFGMDWDMKPLYYLVAGILAISFLGCALLVHSKFGRLLTAIRDNENRVLALGYNTATYKSFIFTLAGMMAGISGALYVASNNSAGPQFFHIADSIEIVIYVAVGGRGTLAGPILGAVLVNLLKTFANEKFKIPVGGDVKMLWPILMGALFIVVVAFLPEGIVGGVRRLLRPNGGRRALARAGFVLGGLAIGLGALALIGYLALPTTPATRAATGTTLYTAALGALAFLVGVIVWGSGIIVSGIGVLRGRSWARLVSMGLALLGAALGSLYLWGGLAALNGRRPPEGFAALALSVNLLFGLSLVCYAIKSFVVLLNCQVAREFQR